MNTQEHLNRIKARCEQLLALAEKRTPGKWMYSNILDGCDGRNGGVITPCNHIIVGAKATLGNSNFIASCAGPAEAGWRATIAAIDWITSFSLVDLSPCSGGSCAVATEVDERLDSIRHHAVAAIIAAWPEELL